MAKKETRQAGLTERDYIILLAMVSYERTLRGKKCLNILYFRKKEKNTSGNVESSGLEMKLEAAE